MDDVREVREDDGVNFCCDDDSTGERRDDGRVKYDDCGRESSDGLAVVLGLWSAGFAEKLYAGGSTNPDPLPRADDAQETASNVELDGVRGDVG